MNAIDTLRRWEGLTTWMYRDSLGYVTAGIGNLLTYDTDALELPWVLVDDLDTAASPDEITRAWQAIATSPKGHAASWYAPLTRVRLLEQTAERIAGERVEREFLPALRRLFPAYDEFPQPARAALLDMVYNLGAHGLAEFHHLRAAVALGQWIAAAAACHRHGISDARNEWTAEQFGAAAGYERA